MPFPAAAPTAEKFNGYPAKNKKLDSDYGPNCQNLWRGNDRLSGSWLGPTDVLIQTDITGRGERAMET
jgi:hypothetical protein